MQEWLLLMAFAVTPMVDEARYSSQQHCQATGREWYARTRAQPDYDKLCRPMGKVDRCKFVCVRATAPER